MFVTLVLLAGFISDSRSKLTVSTTMKIYL
jgi:hypothetical protein